MTTNDCVEGPGAGTAGLQPEIVPFFVAIRNRAAPDAVPSVTTNPAPSLETIPVGAPATVTRGERSSPSPSYTLTSCIAFAVTHHGPVGLAAIPMAPFSSGSLDSAGREPSDTRYCTWKETTGWAANAGEPSARA